MPSFHAVPNDENQDERGVKHVAEKLYSRVTKYHAQIGTNVHKDTLCKLEWNLLTEAKEQFHRGEYEKALNTFTATLAVTEKTRTAKDFAVRGAIVHNIASCLHHLGEIEAAQEYYEQAIHSFEKAKTGVVERVFYGDTNKKRVDFVKERLIDISWGRKPDIDKYLDENGKKRPVPAPPVDPQTKLSSQFDEDAPPPPWAGKDILANSDDGQPAWLNVATRRGPSHDPDRPLKYDAPPTRNDFGSSDASSSRVNRDFDMSNAQRDEMEQGVDGDDSDEPDDATQEKARREWLQYYLQIADWNEAEKLVVTNEEREDLDYLRDREHRVGKEGQLIEGM